MNSQSMDQKREALDWRYLEGVRTRRAAAFVIDYGMILLLILLAIPVIAVLGFATLGAAWLLYAILGPLVALSYIAWTVGGPRQGTWGMQMMNIKLSRYDGQQIDTITAIVHAVIFWATTAVTAPLFFASLFVPFFTTDKRMLQDLALGTVVIRDVRE